MTIQPSTASNNNEIASKAYVKNQNYITSSALTPYALLAGPQTFTGNQNFVTQATSDNSTLAATTAYVKNQGYAVLGAKYIFLLLFNYGLIQNDIGGGSNSTPMYQTGITCSVTNNYNNGSIRYLQKTRESGKTALMHKMIIEQDYKVMVVIQLKY